MNEATKHADPGQLTQQDAGPAKPRAAAAARPKAQTQYRVRVMTVFEFKSQVQVGATVKLYLHIPSHPPTRARKTKP